MAKIQNLEVDTIKFTPNSVTGVTEVSGTGTANQVVTVPNPAGAPVRVFFVAQVRWTFLASNMQAVWTTIVRRVSPQADVLPLQVSRSGGNSSGTARMVGTVYDAEAEPGEQYRIIASVSLQPGGTASSAGYDSWKASFLYRKK